MLTLQITIEGRTRTDVESAIAEATRNILAGDGFGSDENDTGRYTFDIAGEADHQCAECDKWESEESGGFNTFVGENAEFEVCAECHQQLTLDAEATD